MSTIMPHDSANDPKIPVKSKLGFCIRGAGWEREEE
jgi:hypothetical protein